jgi:hypothetical protein
MGADGSGIVETSSFFLFSRDLPLCVLHLNTLSHFHLIPVT